MEILILLGLIIFCYSLFYGRVNVKSNENKNNYNEKLKSKYDDSSFSYEDFVLACRKGDLELVKYLVEERNFDANFKYQEGETALCLACRFGKVDVVRYLVDHGADLKLKNSLGETALFSASKSGNLELVKYLVEEKGLNFVGNVDVVRYLVKYGAYLTVKSSLGEAVLFNACESGNLELVKYLVEEKELNLDNLDFKNNSAFFEKNIKEYFRDRKEKERQILKALKINDLKTVRNLIEEKKVSVKSEAILFCACQSGNLELVKYLVEHGADVSIKYHGKNLNAIRRFGETVLFPACGSGNLELVKYLVEEKGLYINAEEESFGRTAFFTACCLGKLNVVKYLVEHGAKICKDALFYAYRSGNLELVKYLIEQGVDVNSEDIGGKTILFYICESGNLELVKYLVEEKKVSIEKGTILFPACRSGNLELVKYLMKHGEVITRELKKTILFPACRSGNLELVKYLEEQGANINIKWRLEETILFPACESGNLELVKYLLKKNKFHVYYENEKKETILFPACRSGNLELVKYLVDDLDMNIVIHNMSDCKETILFEACYSGNLELVKYLVKDKNLKVIMAITKKTILFPNCDYEKERLLNLFANNDVSFKDFIISCFRKKYYETVEKAKQVADDILKEKNIELHCYHCFYCDNFHLTSRKEGKDLEF